jgi:hypothetical protein
MYNDGVERTQIYLSAGDIEVLDREAGRTGASRSELIRRAIQAQYGRAEASSKQAALERSAGTWKRLRPSGAEYTTAIRGSLEQRLTELGLR